MKYIALIPTRLESKRLPGKALLDLDGLPIIVHTAKEQCWQKKFMMFMFVQIVTR